VRQEKDPARLVPARGTAHKEKTYGRIKCNPRGPPPRSPRCLISLHEKANGTSLDGEGIQAWLEWEWEAMRWCVPVEISRDELEALVKKSTVVLERNKHRLIHEGDWRRWGARGGKETLRRYGPRWFSLLPAGGGAGSDRRS
jgi:hypothetical protein